MPGVTLHFVVARRVVDRWRGYGGQAPFDLDDPSALNAFYHGAVGPDLGYFPGGERLLSDLAHCLRTGTLARTLVHGARTVRERAYAWGWLTHFLADRDVHPLIGRGVGELLHGRPETFVDGSSQPLAHLRVEMGVDAWYARRTPPLTRARLDPVFDETSISFLVRAFAHTYGVVVGPEPFLRSHRATCRRTGQALATVGVLAGLMEEAPGLLRLASRAIRAAYRRGMRSISMAYLNPVRPSAWLLEGIEQALASLTDAFMEHYADGARSLADYNLDTGRPCAVETEHGGALRAFEGLYALMATGADTHGLSATPSPALLGRRSAAEARA